MKGVNCRFVFQPLCNWVENMGFNNSLNDSIVLTSWTTSSKGIGQGSNNASQILLIVSTDWTGMCRSVLLGLL